MDASCVVWRIFWPSYSSSTSYGHVIRSRIIWWLRKKRIGWTRSRCTDMKIYGITWPIKWTKLERQKSLRNFARRILIPIYERPEETSAYHAKYRFPSPYWEVSIYTSYVPCLTTFPGFSRPINLSTSLFLNSLWVRESSSSAPW